MENYVYANGVLTKQRPAPHPLRNLILVSMATFFAWLLVSVCVFFWFFSTHGLSAYEQAVRDGHWHGSFEDWLASLQGAPGQDSDAFMATVYQLYLESEWSGDFLSFLTNHFAGPQGLPGQDGTNFHLQAAAVNAMRSSVSVLSEFQRSNLNGGRPFFGEGSGVIYRLDRDASMQTAYIITNYHVIAFLHNNSPIIARNVSIIPFGMNATNVDTAVTGRVPTLIPTMLVGYSAAHDIAVLRVRRDPNPLTHILFDNTTFQGVSVPTNRAPVVGSPAIVVGDPLHHGMSVTEGVVSTQSELISMMRLDGPGTAVYRVFRTTAAINPGNSGGGVFDSHGRLIGIAKAKLVSERPGQISLDNMGYVIPLDITLRVTHQIIDRVERLNQFSGTPLQVEVRRFGIHLGTRNPVFGIVNGEIALTEQVYLNRFASETFFNVESVLQAGDIIVSVRYRLERENAWVTQTLTRHHHFTDFMIDMYEPTGTHIFFTVIRAGENDGQPFEIATPVVVG